MTGHVKDVHFDFSITNLHSDKNTHITGVTSHYYDDVLIHSNALGRQHMNLLGDAIVDANSGQILGNKPLLTVAFDNAALKRNIDL